MLLISKATARVQTKTKKGLHRVSIHDSSGKNSTTGQLQLSLLWNQCWCLFCLSFTKRFLHSFILFHTCCCKRPRGMVVGGIYIPAGGLHPLALESIGIECRRRHTWSWSPGRGDEHRSDGETVHRLFPRAGGRVWHWIMNLWYIRRVGREDVCPTSRRPSSAPHALGSEIPGVLWWCSRLSRTAVSWWKLLSQNLGGEHRIRDRISPGTNWTYNIQHFIIVSDLSFELIELGMGICALLYVHLWIGKMFRIKKRKILCEKHGSFP